VRRGPWAGVSVRLLVASILGLACLPAPALADWPLYGKDFANSRNGGSGGPSVTQAATLAESWRFNSEDGDFTGTPVVAGGTAVVGSNGGTVFALNARTGALRWSRDLNPGPNGERSPTINGSAAIANGRVYVPVADVDTPRVVALSLTTGSVLWDRVIDSQRDADVFGSPVVWNGSVYIGVSALFGELNDPDVRVRGAVVALDAATGALRWKTFTVPRRRDGGAVWTTPAIDTRTARLYVGTGNAYHKPAVDTTDAMLAVDARNGAIVDHFQATPNDVWNGTTNIFTGPDHDFGASANLFTAPDGRKLVGEGQKSGAYWALDRATMKPVWETLTGPGGVVGGILGSTAYDGQRIYGPDTLGGEIWALDRDGGVGWVSSDGDPVHFGPVTTANGVVYSADMAGLLTAREAGTGVVLAKRPLGAPSWGGIAVDDGTVFAVTGTQGDSGFVVAFRPAG
jgi:polyvinyl alcohol dehydrogenase (cytochrome)